MVPRLAQLATHLGLHRSPSQEAPDPIHPVASDNIRTSLTSITNDKPEEQIQLAPESH